MRTSSSLCLSLLFLLVSCGPSAVLQAGEWTGTLTPMNHPDMANPVLYEGKVLAIDLTGPGGRAVPTRNPRLANDTLRFAFDEPEQQVKLKCTRGREVTGGFAGRCIDATGQWAWFTMRPPE